jgi:hypothetical protein
MLSKMSMEVGFIAMLWKTSWRSQVGCAVRTRYPITVRMANYNSRHHITVRTAHPTILGHSPNFVSALSCISLAQSAG